MKAYQVFKGDSDKHNNQIYELIATYFDKDKALNHCEEITKTIPLYNDSIEFDGWFDNNKIASWSAVGLERMCVTEFREIEITE